MELNISDGAKKILKKIREIGYSAYVTDGTVRDLLVNKIPQEYNISTNAPLKVIKKLFRRIIDADTQNGSVTVVDNKCGYEIKLFGNDRYHSLGNMDFEDAVQADCSEHDFTINAMMYNDADGLKDFYGGKHDIEAKVIKCVGNPEQCFHRDALIMIRAVRFKAQLDFSIDSDTEKAIRKCAVLIKKADRAKILQELNKILISDNPDCIRDLHNLGLLNFIMPELERCFGEPQRNKYHIYDVGEHIMHTVINTPPDLVLRWAALMHDTGKPCCSSTDSNGTIHFYGHHRESRKITMDILYRLHMETDTIREIAVLVENHDYRVDANIISVKRMMAKIGSELFEKLLILQKADNMAKGSRHLAEKLRRINGGLSIYRAVIASKQPYRISDLVVNGTDLRNVGIKPGRDSADVLKVLLDEIIIKPELNNRTYLMKRAKELRRK